MILLHAGLEDGRLLLWGESPSAALSRTAARGRKPKVAQPRPFPFDPGAGQLAAAVADALPEISKQSPGTEQRFLWLPTVEDRPVPSSALIAEPPGPGATAILAPWRTTVLRLDPAQMIDLLDRLRRPEDAGPRRRRRRHARLLVRGLALRRRPGRPRTVPPRRAAVGAVVASPLAAGAGRRRRAAPSPAGAGHAARLPRPRRQCRGPAGTTGRRAPRRVPRHDGRCAGPLGRRRPCRRRCGPSPARAQGRARLRQHSRSVAARPARLRRRHWQGRPPNCVSWPSRSAPGSGPSRWRSMRRSASASAWKSRPTTTGTRRTVAWRCAICFRRPDDPSLLVPVADAWTPQGPVRRRLPGAAASTPANIC